jgi:hypothetical protein
LKNYRLACVAAGARERFLPLLLLADESIQQVRSHINSGLLYVYWDEVDEPVGVALSALRACGYTHVIVGLQMRPWANSPSIKSLDSGC